MSEDILHCRDFGQLHLCSNFSMSAKYSSPALCLKVLPRRVSNSNAYLHKGWSYVKGCTGIFEEEQNKEMTSRRH